MKKVSYSLLSVFVSSLIFTSCDAVKNANNTQKGSAIGAAAGALIGGILGNNVGKNNSALGAVLGGVVGGTAGAIIGKQMDKQAEEIENVIPGAKVERVGEGIKVVLNENTVNFDFNKSDLTARAKSNLDKLIKVFKDNPDTYLNIYGYTDSIGKDEYNRKLSRNRANSVKAYLVANGIDNKRLTTEGMGEADPIADNNTEEGRALNRRVEFAIRANEIMVNNAQNEADKY